METALFIIGFGGLIIGLINPKTFSFLFKESATRPIIILVFSAFILAGAFWNDPGSTGAIGLFCFVAMVIGIVTPDVFKPLLKKYAQRHVIFSIFLLGLIIALSFNGFGKHKLDKPKNFGDRTLSESERSNQKYKDLENRLTETRNLLKDKNNDQALKDVNNILLSPIIENDPKIKAEALRLRADVLYNKGFYENAKTDYERALVTFEILQLWEQQAWCYYYLSDMAFIQKNNPEAIELMLKAENIYKSNNQKFDTGLCQGRLGDFYRSNQELEKSLKYYASARELFGQTNNIDQIAWINCYWALALDQSGKSEEAVNKMSAAIDYYKLKNNEAYLAWCYEFLAPIKLKLNDKDNTIVNYQLAIDYYRKIDNKGKVTEIEQKVKALK